MTKRFLSTFILLSLFVIQAQPSFSKTITIPAGTPVTVMCEKEIDADDVKVDEIVECIIKENVKVNNVTVLKAGTPVQGKIIKKKNNCICGVAGEVQIGDFYIKLKDNNYINLRGAIADKGESRAWVNAGWIFWITLPMVFIKGNDGKIKTGTYSVLYTIDDAIITN
ncbi:hypothetical protein IKJ53_00520 [bacterium]|nr:hypothetical protein [bacterium]